MKNNLLSIGLIVAGVASRLLPHLPNFTMVGAISLFAAVYLPKKYSVSIPLIVMAISDAFLGSHPTIGWVYGSFIAIWLTSLWLKNKITGIDRLALPLMSATVFFVVSNFGVWITTDMYAKTLAGLIECYTLAIPFFKYTLVGDIFYTAVLFGTAKMSEPAETHHSLSAKRSSTVMILPS